MESANTCDENVLHGPLNLSSKITLLNWVVLLACFKKIYIYTSVYLFWKVFVALNQLLIYFIKVQMHWMLKFLRKMKHSNVSKTDRSLSTKLINKTQYKAICLELQMRILHWKFRCLLGGEEQRIWKYIQQQKNVFFSLIAGGF